MGLLSGIKGLGLAGQFGLGIIDTIRGEQNAQRLNKLAEEGRADLQALADEAQGQFGNQATEFRDNVSGAVENSRNNQRGNLSRFAGNYFGVPQGAGAEDALGNVRLGKGGMSGRVDELAGNMRTTWEQEVTPKFGQVRDEVAISKAAITKEYDAIKGTLGDNFRSIESMANATRAEVSKRVDDAIGTAKSLHGDVVKSLVDETARAVRGVATPILQTAQSAISSLSQRLTGDPQKDAIIQRQIDATKEHYANSASEAVATEGGKMRKFSAEVRLSSNQQLNTAMSEGTKTLAETWVRSDETVAKAADDYGRNWNSAFEKFTAGVNTADQTLAELNTAEAKLISDREGNIFATAANAGQFDAEMLKGMHDAYDSQEREYAANKISVEAQYAQLAMNSFLNAAGLRSQAAMSKINATMNFVSWAAPFNTLTEWAFAQDQANTNRQQVENQRRGQNLAAGLGVWNAVNSSANAYGEYYA